MKKKSRFPKEGFKDEESFKKYLVKNKAYILDLIIDTETWTKKKYICDSNILICAMKYALGRKTGIVHKVVDWILEEWDSMDVDIKSEIIEEIISFECNYPILGIDWQREQWYRIINKGVCGYIDELK